MVKTAVLMATYNGEQFISEQLDSVRNQSLKPDYVIMRDDGSTDGTVAFVEDYIRKYDLAGWSIVQNDHNLGWRLNFRQLLIDASQLDVDYVFFSDQDDTWYTDKNEKQVAVMEEHPDMDLLSADIDIEVIGDSATVPNNFVFADKDQPLSKYPQDFSYHNYRQGWTFCMRKSYVDSIVKHYTDDLVVSHDNLTAGVAGVLGTAYNLNQPVGLHKRHGGNASGNLLNLHSTHDRHLYELKLVLSYFTILRAVAQEKESPALPTVQNYYDFNVMRSRNAQQRKWWATIKQILTQGNYYDSMTNRVRDLIFLVKK